MKKWDKVCGEEYVSFDYATICQPLLTHYATYDSFVFECPLWCHHV